MGLKNDGFTEISNCEWFYLCCFKVDFRLALYTILQEEHFDLPQKQRVDATKWQLITDCHNERAGTGMSKCNASIIKINILKGDGSWSYYTVYHKLL